MSKIINHMTIDVEDYFQVSAFENVVGYNRWELFEGRVEANTLRLLDLLDNYNVKATFFVLGWVADHYPEVVLEIDRRGHEIGCHSYRHRLVYQLTPEEFRQDTQQAKEAIERVIGKRIEGYRAPSYSITQKSLWVLPILEELGFTYDSSIFPIHHDRYGMPTAPRFPYRIQGSSLIEYPISTALIFGMRLPVTGGGYFRLFPYWVVRWALRQINQKEEKPFIFYIHPWEIDPDQPRMRNPNIVSKFRHYIHFSKNQKKFEHILKDFRFQPICLSHLFAVS